MASATLSWTNVFTRDLEALPEFYMALFGFPEIPEMRNPVFRGLAAGGVNIGFMAFDVYGILQLEDDREEKGTRFLLNFDVESTEAVGSFTQRAEELGATLVKPASTTSYGWYQSVLRDPEGHVFRINTVLA